MRLIKCYVENFGNLSHYSTDFSDGLTVIKEDNGFGKSTLAAFIKAMFYGLPQSTKRSVDENERKRYTPWQGGAFGGSLDFCVNDGNYRIERFFGAKEKDDTFRLFDLKTGLESSAYDENIGLQLFGIDAESFERSVYLPQREVGLEMNNSLSAKLTNLVENSDDISNYDSAVAAIKKRRSFYSLQNGTRGAIAEAESECLQLEREIADCRVAADNLDTILSDLKKFEQCKNDTDKRISEVRSKITAASSIESALSANKRRDDLTARQNRLSQTVEKIEQRYPEGLPNEQQLQEVLEASDGLQNAVKRKDYIESDTDVNEFKRLKDFFADGVPSENEVNAFRDKLHKAEVNKASAEALLPRINEANGDNPTKATSVKFILIPALALMAVGAALMFVKLLIGIVALAAGIVLSGVSGFVYLKNMITSSQPKSDIADIKQRYKALTDEAQELTQEVGLFVERFIPNGDYSHSIEQILVNLRDYKRLLNEENESKTEINRLTQIIDEKTTYLASFFARFGIGLIGSVPERVAVIKQDSTTLMQSKAEMHDIEQQLKEIPESDIQIDLENSESVEELKQKEAELVKRNDDTGDRITELKARAERFRLKVESLPELVSSLETRKQERDEYKQNLQVLDLATELLETAKTNLSEKYRDVMDKGFSKYTTLLFGEDIGNYIIDTDLNINIERAGKARVKDFFSAGYKNMLDIAMRLSLTDALYEGEKPMMILDDPFVNMDDERVKNSLELLKKLAEERQIIYLTCHSSRC